MFTSNLTQIWTFWGAYLVRVDRQGSIIDESLFKPEVVYSLHEFELILPISCDQFSFIIKRS